jgi:hypothetical protein
MKLMELRSFYMIVWDHLLASGLSLRAVCSTSAVEHVKEKYSSWKDIEGRSKPRAK